MSERTLDIIHRFVIPIIHAMIWAFGLILCFQIAFDCWEYLKQLKNGQIFMGIITIYFVYILELSLNLIDTALVNRWMHFNAWLVFLIFWFIIVVATTFGLSLAFINYILQGQEAKSLLFAIVFVAILLKLTDLLFSKNSEIFMYRLVIESPEPRDV